MSTPLPRIFALAPAALGGAAAVAAGSRAGALGLLDVPGRAGPEAILRTAGAVDRAALGRPFGARVQADPARLGWLDAAPGGLAAVVAAGDEGADWRAIGEAVRRSGRRFLAEVTSAGAAVEAAGAGAEGIVAAGNEGGGRVGEEATPILLQAILGAVDLPTWARGGIGPLGAAGCLAAGAAGVVLDGALLLARESAVDADLRARVARMDGGETALVGPARGPRVRVAAPPGSTALALLRSAAEAGGDAWDQALAGLVGWGPGQVPPIGQDAAFAAGLARRGVTVAGIVQEVDRALDAHRDAARRLRPLAEGSPLAAEHGTRYPIVQGPMTRVSDTPAFASAVADAGALPFLALAMLRGPAVRALLAEAARTLAGRPWGVGVLGFVSPELRREQIEAIREARPPFALIAGGRPDQARELEADGIRTYLHVPSPGLLRQYLRDGARRFVLEGRECGGHVGPRSSLVLWEQAVGALIEASGQGVAPGELSVLLAGGVHDTRSASLAATVAAPLAEKGARVGVLVGTAYLFTAEAVATGAVVPGFQQEALRCGSTVLLETGPGHEVRVSPTPFALRFEAERRRLSAEGRPHDEIRAELERLNAGRLRVAAKGVDRDGGADAPLVPVEPDRQFDQGVYMLGQAAALRREVTTIAHLHREIADAHRLLEDCVVPAPDPGPEARPSDIAIVGMSAIFPAAGDVRTFWENTLRGLDAIVEIPPDRWDWRSYYDPDPKAPDKVISKWGGFVPDVPFDPLRYGMPPASLPSIEPVQLLTLEAVRSAIADAGYAERPFPRERTAVVLGIGGGAAQMAMGYAFRAYLPMLDAIAPGTGREALEHCEGLLPEWTEDSFPGFLLNVAAGRVANRFDLGGANYAVDAACGSSLAAAALAVRELESGAADVAILGGADTVQNPLTYLAFSKTQAFSPRGRCRPFDASADGIVISEGVAAVVLKRLADAERDGDRIYAVIKGLGASSDGRARGLTAPRPEGQVRALERAYRKAGVGPETVGYVETHGTGTAVGDAVEVAALGEVFRASGAEGRACAIGSVKSSIGHTKCAAGMAGLINAALALHHEVLPPTIGVETPNPRAGFGSGPFHVSTKARPWLHRDPARPRRAGVSAFGFGGTNFHAVLEAYEGKLTPPAAPVREWPAELLVWNSNDRAGLLAQISALVDSLSRGARPALRDLAHATARAVGMEAGATLAIVASSIDDLLGKLGRTRSALESGEAELHDPRGVEYAERPDFAGSPVAFLFPGQGAQAVEMLLDLAIAFPEVRGAFDEADAALVAAGRPPVGTRVFPPPAFSDEEREAAREALVATEVAQPAVGAASVGMLRLLDALGLRPDLAAGHSYGELVALHAAGAFDASSLAELSEARGRLMVAGLGPDRGAMAALAADGEAAGRLLDGVSGVSAVNWNGPRQTVVAGPAGGVARVLERARAAGVAARPLPVACAFHTAEVAGARTPFAGAASRLVDRAPAIPVYSNLDARPHPADPAAIADRLGSHLAEPVRFAEMVGAMHAAGARVFVEVGPGGVLAPLVGSILEGRPHLAVSLDAPGRPGIPALLHSLARLVAAGVPLRLERLTADRVSREIDPADLPPGDGSEPLPPSTWLVNGSRARPIDQPEPRRLGQAGLVPVVASKPASPNGFHATNGHASNGHAPTPQLNGKSPVPAPSPIPGRDAAVLSAFQETMRNFLEVQRSAVLAYLGRPFDSPPPTAPMLVPPRPAPPAAEAPPALAPAPASAPLTTPEPAPPEQSGRDLVSARLLAIVRDRTGYPAEMLRLELDLEADLGIDSIKRVEILGSLRESLPALGRLADTATMDALSQARTLGAIVDRASKALESAANDSAPAGGKPVAATSAVPRGEPVRRLILEAVDCPLGAEAGGLAPGGVVLLTDDGRGVARRLAAGFGAKGHPAAIVGAGVDWSSPSSVESALDRTRSLGPLAGVVHAAPLAGQGGAGLDPGAWSARLGAEVKGLFLLARAAARDLEGAAARGGATLLAATAMGGAFASVGAPPEGFFPGQGGVVGLAKTLAREWPSVRVRAVDFEAGVDPSVAADRLLAEAFADDGWAEVGHRGGRRVRLRAVPSALAVGGSPRLEVRPGEPIVLTGGARGITAAVALELARRWQPTLLLVGSGPDPDEAEDPATRGLDGAELKAALHARLRRGRGEVGPAELERAFAERKRAREVRVNLDAIRDAGSNVVYAQADVRDAAALAAALDGWRSRFGPPVGVIHGAGVIKDKLLRDKTPESFDRVLGTKVEGALNLARLVPVDSLRFLAMFSSVAGRFGNRGQSDYAAANEILNKLAVWLDRRCPGRAVSLIWGPWSGVGMVSELEGHLGRQGLGMISPERGRAGMVDELQWGPKGAVEVILAGALGGLDGPRPRAAVAAAEAAR